MDSNLKYIYSSETGHANLQCKYLVQHSTGAICFLYYATLFSSDHPTEVLLEIFFYFLVCHLVYLNMVGVGNSFELISISSKELVLNL